jgi:hypothetical protein
MNFACSIALSTIVNFAGDGRVESSSDSFLADKIVAAKRIAYFRSSVMGAPHLRCGRVGATIIADVCYKLRMPKIIEQWLLFKYIKSEFTPLSKPLKTKQQAEKARLKYPERERNAIGIGVIRLKSGKS